MKKEIEEIFDDVLQQDWDYFEQKTITMTYQDRIINNTLSLFEKTIDDCQVKVAELLKLIFVEDDNYMSYAKQIIDIIKAKIKE